VKRTTARKGEIARIAPHRQMPDLRVHDAAQGTPVDEKTAANSRPHSDIGHTAQSAAGAKLRLGQCGGIHIGIDRDWPAKSLAQRPDQIGPAPTRLRGLE
jgi:hypothetical protein